MAGLDLSQLSSNWKKLQGKLQAEKKQEPSNHGLKRKRPDEKTKDVNGHKKAKLTQTTSLKLVKGRRMAVSASKPGHGQPADRKQSNLTQHRDIPCEDISAAYGLDGPSNGISIQQHSDEINAGLHPTHRAGKYIALDCEMVGTGPPPHLDHVLARASLVNFHGEQIYDSYVLPLQGIEVKDYRTFVSGINSSHLQAGYARPFSEVQKDVARLLDGRMLVGHALRNDLQALLFSHPKQDMRDTSRYAKFRVASKGRPRALRDIARAELGIKIQEGEHSSLEDARAAMMLFKNDRSGFEQENRRLFGQHTKLGKGQTGGKKVNGATTLKDDSVEHDGYDEEVEDASHFDLLDGEDDGASGSDEESKVAPDQMQAPRVKRKHKKKKRTKRK